MNIRFLGAHNREAQRAAYSCLLIDGVLAVDAGALTARLPMEAQLELQAVLLTHRHYDHVRDLPGLAMNLYSGGRRMDVLAAKETRDDVAAFLFDGRHYPNFLERPAEAPTLRFITVTPGEEVPVAEYAVTGIPMTHAVPAIGYLVTSGTRSVFCTGDTGPGLAERLRPLSPSLLVVEVTLANEAEDLARVGGHLTPSLLQREMADFRQAHGYLPEVVATHMELDMEQRIEAQLDDVAEALDHPVLLGYEGMVLSLAGAT